VQSEYLPVPVNALEHNNWCENSTNAPHNSALRLTNSLLRSLFVAERYPLRCTRRSVARCLGGRSPKDWLLPNNVDRSAINARS
jgi:hypothetical protein